MAVPENFRPLGTIGTAYKGVYDPKKQYKYLNEVYYEGSSYIALKDNPVGPPNANGVNWNYSARGGSGGGGGAVDSVNGKTGVVELTAEDIEAVAIKGDTADNIVAFISNDTIDDDATSWTIVPKLESEIKHSTLAQRISQMFKNVRYLKKLLGTTDISELGDGTVTGALSSLNSKTENNIGTGVSLNNYTSENNLYTFPSDGYLVIMSIGNGSYARACIYSSDNTNHFYAAVVYGETTYPQLPVFVKKGMRVFITGSNGSESSGTYSGIFNPFI